jgi:hypothetical protein
MNTTASDVEMIIKSSCDALCERLHKLTDIIIRDHDQNLQTWQLALLTLNYGLDEIEETLVVADD